MDKKHMALARVIERALFNQSTDLAREAARLGRLADKMRAARERKGRPSRDVLASVLYSGVARASLARFLDREPDVPDRELFDAIDGRAPAKPPAASSDPVAQAAAIVRDATEVDWSRDPQTEYEGAIRRAFIADRLARNVPFGWIELLMLVSGRRDWIGADLAAAAMEAEERLRRRVEERERRELREARDAVDREATDSDAGANPDEREDAP